MKFNKLNLVKINFAHQSKQSDNTVFNKNKPVNYKILNPKKEGYFPKILHITTTISSFSTTIIK